MISRQRYLSSGKVCIVFRKTETPMNLPQYQFGQFLQFSKFQVLTVLGILQNSIPRTSEQTPLSQTCISD